MSEFPETEGMYRPVSCARYAELELSILHGNQLCLVWRQGNVLYYRRVSPYDLRTCNHEEFLLCRSHVGENLKIRLDCIRRVVQM